MIPPCIYPKRYMVSECGKHANFFDSPVPGWTDVSDMSDEEVVRLMVRRMMANEAVIDELEVV